MDSLDVIIKHIDDKVHSLKEAIASDRATTFEEYKKLCGEIRGLRIAKEYIFEVKSRLEHEE